MQAGSIRHASPRSDVARWFDVGRAADRILRHFRADACHLAGRPDRSARQTVEEALIRLERHIDEAAMVIALGTHRARQGHGAIASGSAASRG